MQLADQPDVVVATPSRALTYLRAKLLDIARLESLVIDEADLILSYGHSADDIRAILTGTWGLPAVYQSFLMSATMTGDVEELQGVVLRNPVRRALSGSDPTDLACRRSCRSRTRRTSSPTWLSTRSGASPGARPHPR